MKRINSRAKGACAERELAKALEELTGVKLQRKLEQTRSGGHDLEVVEEGRLPPSKRKTQRALDRYAIEVKRYATATHGTLCVWWMQAREQAERADKIPCLAYRVNHGKWQIVTPLSDITGCKALPHDGTLEMTGTLSLKAWVVLIENKGKGRMS